MIPFRSATFLLFTLFFLIASLSAKQTRPNIIFLLSDDQGYGDMGRHGHPFLETPNMDRYE